MSTPNQPPRSQLLIAGGALAAAVAALVVGLMLAVPAYRGLVAEREAQAQAAQRAVQAEADAQKARAAVTDFEAQYPGIADWPTLKERATERCASFNEENLPVNETTALLFEATLTTTELFDEPVEARLCPGKYWAMAKGYQAIEDTQETIGEFTCEDEGSGAVMVQGTLSPTIPAEIVEQGGTLGQFKMVAAAVAEDGSVLVEESFQAPAYVGENITWSHMLKDVPASATGCKVAIVSWWDTNLQ